MYRQLVGLAFVGILAASTLAAQYPPLVLPQASQAATVSQTVGLTEISISYHRPAVAGREVWGKLVPFDTVWRAGANENTVISFSTPVKLAGQDLAAGRYGLHMIPSRDEWTVILSRDANAWGSFAYDPKADVLRVKTTPAPAPDPVERLIYTFDGTSDSTVVATLRWEKLTVPIPIAVDTRQVVLDSLRQQLTGLHQFFWQPWSQAAAWCVANNVNLDEATTWADRSIAIQENFTNLRVKAALAEKRGEGTGAEELRRRALAIAGEADINSYGYALLTAGKTDSAIAVFQKNVKDHPKSWNTYDSLAEAYAKKGDKRRAIEMYTKARRLTQDPNQHRRIDGAVAALQG